MGVDWTTRDVYHWSASHDYLPLYERLLPILVNCKPTENGHDLGVFLSFHKSHIGNNRIEMLFQEDNQDYLLDTIEQILSILSQKSNISIDYGIFLDDLSRFQFTHKLVLRQWATSYFTYQSFCKEDGHV